MRVIQKFFMLSETPKSFKKKCKAKCDLKFSPSRHNAVNQDWRYLTLSFPTL